MRRYFWARLAILGTSLVALPSFSASFDCATAVSDLDKLVCTDTELSALDDDMAAAYGRLKAQSKGTPELTRDQRQWLARRNRCTDRSCIKSSYELRVAELRRRLSQDACFTVGPIAFESRQVSRVCKSQVPELNQARLDLDGFTPLGWRMGKELINCEQYLESTGGPAGVGGWGTDRPGMALEYGTYIVPCVTVYAVARATPPKRSFFGRDPISFRNVPPTVLPAFTSDQDDELQSAAAAGHSIESWLIEMKREEPAFDAADFLAGWKLVLHLRADLDGDGIEDALVSHSYNPPLPAHHFGYAVGVLQKNSSEGPARWTDLRDFKWVQPELIAPHAGRPGAEGR